MIANRRGLARMRLVLRARELDQLVAAQAPALAEEREQPARLLPGLHPLVDLAERRLVHGDALPPLDVHCASLEPGQPPGVVRGRRGVASRPVTVPFEATFPSTPSGVGAMRREVAAFARRAGMDEDGPRLGPARRLGGGDERGRARLSRGNGRWRALRCAPSSTRASSIVVVGDDRHRPRAAAGQPRPRPRDAADGERDDPLPGRQRRRRAPRSTWRSRCPSDGPRTPADAPRLHERPVVEERGRLLPRRRDLRGLRRRRRRRLPRADRQGRLPRRASASRASG